MSVFGIILVRIFPAFSQIWTEYGEILYLSLFSPNAGKYGKNADQNNSEYWHFLRSGKQSNFSTFSENISQLNTAFMKEMKFTIALIYLMIFQIKKNRFTELEAKLFIGTHFFRASSNLITKMHYFTKLPATKI